MIAIEDGPFNIFFRLREFMAKKFGITHWIYEGFNCVLCMSFWASLLTTAIVFQGVSFVDFGLLWLGMSGAVTTIHKIIYRG